MPKQPRVLLIGPELILRWTESTARALESFGCPVKTLLYNSSPVRRGVGGLRRFLTERAGIRLGEAPPRVQEGYARWLQVRRRRAMVRTAREFRPDLVLVLKGESVHPATLAKLKASTGAGLVVWWVDHPFMNAETGQRWRYVPDCTPLFDHCFVFDRSYEASLREAGARATSFLPCAADPGIFKPLTLTTVDHRTYGASVSLVGVYSERRGQVISALCKEPGLGVWGPGWHQFFRTMNGAAPQVRGEGLVPEEACKVYNAGAINLNTHHLQSRRGGLNTRSFEIPAAGAFELTDYVPDMESLLEPGREVAVYRSPEEAADLARFYVKAEDQRRRIAEAGYRRVLAEHTYRHRMEALLEVVAK